MMYAPIAVFAYRRPDHLRRTIESLIGCALFEQSPVHVFFDGARDAAELERVEATRKIARELLGERAEYYYSDSNRGLSESIIEGVGMVLDRYGRIIVVEDDLILHQEFLIYMNKALDKYADENSVYQVSGFQFDLPEPIEDTQAFFLPFTVSWGWATWGRAWKRFDTHATGWERLEESRDLRYRFNVDGAYDYATMLKRQMQGMRDSWAIRWYWSVFIADGLVLFPPNSFVSNIGFDGSGTHGRGIAGRFSGVSLETSRRQPELPAEVRIDMALFERVRQGMRRQSGGWVADLANLARRLLKR